MSIKEFNPVTKSSRGTKLVNKSGLYKEGPKKCLTKRQKKAAGRNNSGQITVRRKSTRFNKTKFRIIDFKRNKYDVKAIVERIEYDPNRSAFIALVKYEDGKYSYIIAPEELKIGNEIISSLKPLADIKPGYAMVLRNIPIGTTIHNIELRPKSGAKFVRSAGNFAQLVGKDDGYAIVKLQSGETRMFLLDCMATVGTVSNPDKKNEKLGKAGRSRWIGRRPSVRGESMNPVDHPHGGRTRGGRLSVSPTGVYAKGGKTRKKNKSSNKFILTRRKNNKGK